MRPGESSLAAGRRNEASSGNDPAPLDDRIALIRGGYERFNEQDFDGLVAMLDEDVEWPDVVNDAVLHGAHEVRDYFERIFAITKPLIMVGDVIEIGDAVVASTYQAFYDHEGRLLGEPRMVVNRFSFKGDLIAAMVLTSQGDIPQELRRLFVSR